MEAFEAAGRLHGVHDWEAAAEQYSAALSAFEREPAGQEKIVAACHDRRGACLAALERHDEAIESHTSALELCPDVASAWHNRGEALMLRGSLAEAQSDLEQALRLQDTEQTARMLQHVRLEMACPPEAHGAFTKALECYGRHEHEEAKALFVEARELGHTRPGRCHNGEGICYTSSPSASRADLEAAVLCFDAAIEAEPENPRPWHNRGTAKARLGRGEEAENDAMAATTLTHAFRRGGHTGSGSAGGAAAALHGGDDESLPSYSPRATLEGLKMSALMERARALGAPGDAVDECMDTPDPRASLIAMLEAWEGAAEEEEEGELLGEGGLREKARRLVGALAAAGPQTDGGAQPSLPIHSLLRLLRLQLAADSWALCPIRDGCRGHPSHARPVLLLRHGHRNRSRHRPGQPLRRLPPAGREASRAAEPGESRREGAGAERRADPRGGGGGGGHGHGADAGDPGGRHAAGSVGGRGG